MQNYRQKIKLLKLEEILRRETDEDHALTTEELCQKLDALGITCDRRTLKRDIDLLNAEGYEVLSKKQGHCTAYYVPERCFSIPELRILLDAVQASGFITTEKTEELSQKLRTLCSVYEGQALAESSAVFNARKHSNEQVLIAVDTLERAIREKKKVSFRYFDLDENRQRVFRKDGERYVTDPLSLLYTEDFYYLIAYTEKHHGTTPYRIDRMVFVRVESEPVCAEAEEQRALGLKEYSQQIFRTYSGPLEHLTLRFSKKQIGCVYDQFGEKTAVRAVENGLYETDVTIQTSPVFWGWLFQFAGDMTIVSPPSAINEYLALARKVTCPPPARKDKGGSQ